MTEIALALAMGFFSLMVLTLISMGAGGGERRTSIVPAVVALAPSTGARSDSTEKNEKNDLIVIFDGERFLDTSLAAIDPAAVVRQAQQAGRRVVLALDPALSVQKAIEARERVGGHNLVISSLDQSWLTALRSKGEIR
ncbi:MAG: hypothetical protein VW547_04650 [Alphaproteobacteria bacterium]